MALGYRNFGPCTPQVGTGSSSAMEALGVAERGGRVALDLKDKSLFSDAGGSEVPVELQTMLALAFVDIDLMTWDPAVLDKMIAAAEASATAGVAGAPGALLGTGGFLKGLYMPSATGRPWYFPSAKLEPLNKQEGTDYAPLKLRFKCIRFVAGTAVTAAAAVLYTNAAPP